MLAFREGIVPATWQGALERLMAAAEDPSEEALDHASRQFSIAVHAEGLMPFRTPGKRRGR
ncbi:MAG: hypothetical protein WAV18_00550 [Roseiarcus sp.]